MKQVVKELRSEGINSFAVVFINSYMSSKNETIVKKIIEELCPEAFISISSDIDPQWREYERTNTTTINAYVAPVLRNYVQELERKLKELGFSGELLIVLSDGGVVPSSDAPSLAVRALAAGPAGGVVAAKNIANTVGFRNVIGLDMGGTTTLVSMLYDGQYRMRDELAIEFGYEVRVPTIDVVAIGNGGGSIAWADEGGALHVGPRSAGAKPGPACFGFGGTEPTITDANVVLGRLNPKYLLGGILRVYRDKATHAVKKIADHYGISVEEAALGILQIALNNMENAIRRISVERGYDPRDFVIFAYGGAGPMYAAFLAEELSISKVLVPPNPGMTNAIGFIMSDIRHDYVKTFIARSEHVDCENVQEAYRELERTALERLRLEKVDPKHIELLRAASVRYLGQAHELTVPVSSTVFDKNSLSKLMEDFRNIHLREYGYAGELTDPVEIVNLRAIAYGKFAKPKLRYKLITGNLKQALIEERSIYFQSVKKPELKPILAPVYDREKIPSKGILNGPAIVEQYDSTIVLPLNWKALVDEYGNMLLTPKLLERVNPTSGT